MGTNNNAIPELIEILLRVVKGNEPEDHDVRAELRVHSVTLTTDECIEFVVQLDRAQLSLDLDGFEVVPKSRYGEPNKPNDVTVEYKYSKETTRQAEAAGKIELNLGAQPSAAFAASAGGSAATKTSQALSTQHSQKLLRVKARGNLTWEVTEPEPTGGTAVLDDTYLNDEVLCKIKASRGANMLAVRLAAFARNRDIKITAQSSKFGIFTHRSKNHEKMLNALIKKALDHSRGNGGTITFSVSEVIIEDDDLQ